MTPHVRANGLFVLGAVLLGAAALHCGSSDSSDLPEGAGADARAAAGPRPRSEMPLASLDDACDETPLSGRTVLSMTLPSYAATLTWREDAGAPTAVDIALAYEGGEITCIPAWGGLGPDQPEVLAEVKLEVRITFRTADGVFAESFPATLSSFVSETPRLSGSIAITELRGTYRAMSPSTSSLGFSGVAGNPEISGSVAERDDAKGTGVTAASWR